MGAWLLLFALSAPAALRADVASRPRDLAEAVTANQAAPSSFVQVGWPDKVLPPMDVIKGELNGQMLSIQDGGLTKDGEAMDGMSDEESTLQDEYDELFRQMQSAKGDVERADAIHEKNAAVGAALQENGELDIGTVNANINQIETDKGENNCDTRTGLNVSPQFAGQPCSDKVPSGQKFLAKLQEEELENEAEGVKEEGDESSEEIDEEKEDMMNDASEASSELNEKAADTKENMQQYMEALKEDGNEMISDTKNAQSDAASDVSAAGKAVAKLDPAVAKAEKKFDGAVSGVEDAAQKIKDKAMQAIIKYAEKSGGQMSKEEQAMVAALMKTYNLSEKELEKGGEHLMKLIEKALEEANKELENAEAELSKGPEDLAKNLNGLQSGPMKESLSMISSIAGELNAALEATENAGEEEEEAIEAQSASPLESPPSTTEQGVAAEFLPVKAKIQEQLRSTNTEYRDQVSSTYDATTASQRDAEEKLVGLSLDLDKALEALGGPGKLTKEMLEAAMHEAMAAGEGGQHAMEAKIAELFGPGGKIETMLAEQQSEEDGGYGYKMKEMEDFVSSAFAMDPGPFQASAAAAGATMDSNANKASEDIMGIAMGIERKLKEMNTAVDSTSAAAKAVDKEATNFRNNEVKTYQKAGVAAAQGLRTEALDTMSDVRQSVQRYLEAARSNVGTVMLKLQQMAEYYGNELKGRVNDDDQRSRSFFEERKAEFQTEAKAVIEQKMAEARAKLQAAVALMPGDSPALRRAVERCNAINAKLKSVKPVEVESLAQQAHNQLTNTLAAAMKTAMEEIDNEDESTQSKGGKAFSLAAGGIRAEVERCSSTAEKTSRSVILQIKALLKDQGDLHSKIKWLLKEDESQEGLLAGLAMALSQDVSESAADARVKFDDFKAKMKEAMRGENGGIQAAFDSVLQPEQSKLDQFMDGVFKNLDKDSENAARQYYKLGTELAQAEKEIEARNAEASAITNGTVTNLKQYMEQQGQFSDEVEEKLRELYGTDLEAAHQKAIQQEKEASSVANAAYAVLDGIDQMFEHGAMEDIAANARAVQSAVTRELGILTASEQEAQARAEAEQAKEKAALEEAAEAFEAEANNVDYKWHQMQQMWRGLSEQNAYDAQKLHAQGRALLPQFIDEVSRFKVNRDKIMKSALGVMGSLFLAVFRGVKKIEADSHAHVENSMQYVNKLADTEGSDAIRILDKLRDADVSIKHGDAEMTDLFQFAGKYAKLDAAWRKEVVKAFSQFAEKLGMNTQDIVARIQALDRDIMLDVKAEESADQQEIEAEEAKTTAATGEQENRVNGELENLRLQDAASSKEGDKRIDNAESQIGGEMDEAASSALALEKDMGNINKKIAGIGETMGAVNEKEEALQEASIGKVEKDRNGLQDRIKTMMNPDQDEDAVADQAAQKAQALAEQRLFGDDPQSFLQLRKGKLDGTRVTQLLQAGASDREVEQLVLNRHKELVKRLHAMQQ